MEHNLIHKTPRTVLARLTETADYLASFFIETPRLDAEVLLAHVLGTDKAGLYRALYDSIPPQARENLDKLLQRRIKGEPISYILGSKEFWSLTFTVGSGVMVPRPETETLVEAALDLLPPNSSPNILDIGTGSGAIAIALAKERPHASIIAIDISPQALVFARKNAVSHRIKTVTFLEGDLFEPVTERTGSFDLIVSNPPYIPTDQICQLAPGLRDFEPHAAFDGGPDGLELYRRIAAQAHHYLTRGGVLLLEVGYDQSTPVQGLLTQDGVFSSPEVYRDLGGIERVVMARKKSAGGINSPVASALSRHNARYFLSDAPESREKTCKII